MSSLSSRSARADGPHDLGYDLGLALATERPRLARLCRQLAGDDLVAEDLAQETLLEAWRLRDRLHAPEGLSAWLSAIARNVCLRWLRAQGRERAHLPLARTPQSEDDSGAAAAEDRLLYEADEADEADEPLAEIERAEVLALLERALATLPATTRALTVASADLTTAELARRFQLSEGAVRVRLHRGRQALRQALAGELRAEAEALELTLPATSDWRESRIWCPFCGVGHLRYRIDRTTGAYAFVCAGGCEGLAVAGSAVNGELVRQVSSPKALVTRHCLALATAYREALAGVQPTCDCGAPMTFNSRFPGDLDVDAPYGVIGVCPRCGPLDASTAWHLALDTAEAQRFWRRHPRMRSLPIELMERDNRAAIVTGFEAVGGGARLVIVSDAHTYALLHVAATEPE